MGIVKVVALSATAATAGFLSVRTGLSVARLNSRVRRIQIPSSTLLEKRLLGKRTKGDEDYFIDVFAIELPSTQLSLDVSDVVRSFYSSKAFSFEKILLKLLYSHKEPVLKDLSPGQQILGWTVGERTNDEMIVQWHEDDTPWGTPLPPLEDRHGCTWFRVSPDQRFIMLGSAGYLNGHIEDSPLDKLANTVTILKDKDQSILERLVKAEANVRYAAIIAGHQLYSRVLLESTLKHLCHERI